jgi:hypothetical protein
MVLVGVLAVGLAGGSSGPHPGHLALAGYGNSSLGSAPGSERPPAAAQTLTTRSFTIVGSVSGLYPGFSSPLVLTVANQQAFTIAVTSITTTVKDATAACLASNLSVLPFSGQLSVPAFGSAKTTVLARLAPSTPDTCIGATFRLSYSGLARKAEK